MQANDIFDKLTVFLGPESVARDVPTKNLTSMRVGGNADLIVTPDSLEKIVETVKFLSLSKIPHYVIGNGTNMIFPDDGYRGVIVRIGPQLSGICIAGTTIIAQAGASLAAIATRALEEGLSGFEFASGIPGTVGGAVAMNAGAYGGEMCQVVTETKCIDASGEPVILKGCDHEFGYRRSRIQNDNLIAVEVALSLKNGDRDGIKALMAELNAKRREKQPLNMPSAGSTFKRPEGYFAGKLIEDCGLKGYTIGGAQVSDKHCGFIVNTGNATSRDITDLIAYVQTMVYENKGVKLETEVKIIGG